MIGMHALRQQHHPIARLLRFLLLFEFAAPVVVTTFPLVMTAGATATATATTLPPRVAVIGGGAAGLTAARILSRAGLNPMVLEKERWVGGVWQYTPNAVPDQPMYRGLRTNLPKEIMAFREFPWPLQPASFVTHEDVQHYLEQYKTKYQLDQFIYFGCRVQQLTKLNQERSRLSPSWEDWPCFRLNWTSVDDEKQESAIFDAVYVCNGHYAVPSMPRIPGLTEHFCGTVMHSIAYDDPSVFSDQIVLCIGGRASGSDLAREISSHAKQVFLSDSVAPELDKQGMPPLSHDNVVLVPRTVQVRSDGSIQFDGNCALMPHVDTIIFCTGYDYSFPFLNNDSNVALDAPCGSRRVMPVVEQLWHADYPNLAFIGLPHSVVPFPAFELQAEATLEQWLCCTLPPRSARRLLAQRDAESGGEGKEKAGRVPQDTHYLGNAQWDYKRRMARYANLSNDAMEDFLETNQAIYEHATKERKAMTPGMPDAYRSVCYERDDKNHSFRTWLLQGARR